MSIKRFGAVVLFVCTLVGLAGASSQELRRLVGSTFPAHVVSVIDGDTVDVVRPGQQARLRVRLEGIDSPESGEPFSQVARQRTRVLTFDQDVRVEGRDVDRYGRLVARLIVGVGARAVDVSVALVGEGLACHFRQYSSDRSLVRAETDARTAGRGFWARDAQKPRCVAINAGAASRGAPAPTTPRPLVGAPITPAAQAAFIGNVNSRVFHAPTCRNAACPNCTRRFASRAEAEGAGFRPAGDCLRGPVEH